MEEERKYLKLSLKLMRLEKEKIRQAKVQAKESDKYIFMPTNDLEASAIALATEGKSGWNGSLYSLDYYDRYLEQTCFIFATQPKVKNNDSWLLVVVDSSDSTKYWIALGEKLLSEIYYSWAKVAGIINPQFDSRRMTNINYIP